MQSQYRIMKQPTGELTAIKIGFNWVMFFSTPAWCMILFGIWGLIEGHRLSEVIQPSLGMGLVFGIPIGVIPGFIGNKFKLWRLQQRQCQEVGIVTAGNDDAAIALFKQSSKT